MGLLTNSKLLTETENIAPKNKTERIQPQKSEKQEKQPQREGKNDKKYRARFTPVKKAEKSRPQERQRREGKDTEKPQRQPVKKQPREIRSAPVKFTALGGLNEIGKNLYVYECCNDMFIVDCGLAFPDDDMPGVDLVVPDFTYLEKNRDRFRGIVITHGHEDHIGALPYHLRYSPYIRTCGGQAQGARTALPGFAQRCGTAAECPHGLHVRGVHSR